MDDKVYLDEQGNPKKQYLDEQGNPSQPQTREQAQAQVAATAKSQDQKPLAQVQANIPSPDYIPALKKSWEIANQGLISGPNIQRAASMAAPPGVIPTPEATQAIAAEPPRPNDSPTIAGLRHGIAGAIQDTSQTASGFTSPVSIGLIGAGALGRAPAAAGQLGRALEATGSGINAAQGLKQGVEGGIDIAKNGVTPENLQNTLQGGAGLTAGVAGGLHSAAGASPNLANKINNTILGTTDIAGKKPGLAVAKENITTPILSNDKGLLRSKIQDRLSSLENTKQGALTQNPVRQNVEQSVLQPIHDAAIEAAKHGDKNAIAKLGDLNERLSGSFQAKMVNGQPTGEMIRFGNKNYDMTAKGIHELKKDIGDITDWKKHGTEYKQLLNGVNKEIYRNLDQTVDQMVPEYKGINERQAPLITAKKQLGDTIRKESKIPGLNWLDFATLGARRGMPLTGIGTNAASLIANPSNVPFAPAVLAPKEKQNGK